MTAEKDGEALAQRSSISTRLSSIAALCGAVCAIGYIGTTVYHVATDGFVAPIILSPDSDIVLQGKLSMSQLIGEKMKIAIKKDAIDAELAGAEQAIEQLKALHSASSKALEWTSTITAQQAVANNDDLRTLANQRAVLTAMIADGEKSLEKMKQDMEAGLIAKADYERGLQSMKQLQLSALENDRARIVNNSQLNQVRLTQQALNGGNSKARISTPEMLMQQDQLVRVQCEMIRLEAERRSKVAERRHLDEELEKIEQLLAQLNARPLFRAIEANTNVAFVPYSQIDGVAKGARIYDCIWGVFACKPVGKIAELLPGEAIVPDPWGTPARGQYAIMELEDMRAAQSKTLRVRPSSTAIAAVTQVTGTQLAKK